MTSDASWHAPAVERHDVDMARSERAALQAWLGYHRATLLGKCAGLSAAQLKQASVPPSNLTLLGLVRHMSDVERSWFRRRLGGADATTVPPIYFSDDDPDGEFDQVANADAAQAFATFAEECAAADAVAGDYDLDATFVHRDGITLDLRWVYLHLIEEYARHNGHADLLRERIDGATGE